MAGHGAAEHGLDIGVVACAVVHVADTAAVSDGLPEGNGVYYVPLHDIRLDTNNEGLECVESNKSLKR